jgi:peptide-methionine (S)-S-oxide reductase
VTPALATLGGGCFWCLEAVFELLRGVQGVTSGYAGGEVPAPSYEAVCSGRTGHAEVVQVAFDPAVIGFRDLLEVFFTIHDPTTRDRQGADVGTQYRSVIFTHDPGQAAEARSIIAALAAARTWPDPIVTQVVPLDRFWPAESYHHRYYQRNPMQPYCAFTIAPKVAKLRTYHLDRLRA